jgi:hypothetical protein
MLSKTSIAQRLLPRTLDHEQLKFRWPSCTCERGMPSKHFSYAFNSNSIDGKCTGKRNLRGAMQQRNYMSLAEVKY